MLINVCGPQCVRASVCVCVLREKGGAISSHNEVIVVMGFPVLFGRRHPFGRHTRIPCE